MSIPTTRTVVAVWHFQCPECGFGDVEAGCHASLDTIHCEICLEEGRYVRLKRWPVEDSGLPASGGSGRRAR